MSGDLGPWLDQKPKVNDSACPEGAESSADMDRQDAAIRGFSQEYYPMPYLAVPRRTTEEVLAEAFAHFARAAEPLRPVRTEVEILRERVAAMEAQIAVLTPPPAAPVPNPMTRAVSRWPGSQGFIQGIRWQAGR
jgi:hypothetical protein